MDSANLVEIVKEGLLPWQQREHLIFDSTGKQIGAMDTTTMAKFVVESVNYIWETS